MLLSIGKLALLIDDEEEELGPGSFAGEIDNMKTSKIHSTTLVAKEDSQGFLIKAEDML